MSSNIEVQRICQHCGNEFTAKTTVTKYCSHRCGSLANKALRRAEKVQKSNAETKRIKLQPVEDLKAKEFLTVREVAQLLNCSVRSAYYYIECGTINAINLGQRITRVKRSDIDKLFETPVIEKKQQAEQTLFGLSDCYTLTEVREKFNVSSKSFYEMVKRNNIPKIRNGKNVYVLKTAVDKLLS